MKVTICDDVQHDIDHLVELCKRYGEQKNIEVSIIEEKHPQNLRLADTDVLLLDIKMPGFNGIDIQRKQEMISGRPLIIFVSHFPEYGLDSHGTNVIGFLVKPAKQEELFDYLDKAVILLSANKIIELGNQTFYNTRQIQYIVMEKGCSKAVLQNGERSIGIFKTISKWEEELSAYGFVRIRKGCLVNCFYIRSIQDGNIILKNGESLSVARREYRDCKEKYLAYLERHARFV